MDLERRAGGGLRRRAGATATRDGHAGDRLPVRGDVDDVDRNGLLRLCVRLGLLTVGEVQKLFQETGREAEAEARLGQPGKAAGSVAISEWIV